MIVTVSPSLYHADECMRTLNFGSTVRFIQNNPETNVVENKFFNKNQYYLEKKPQEKKKKVEVPWKGLNPGVSQYYLDTKFGKINVLDNGASAQRTQLIVLMHACPSSCDELLHFFPALTYYGFRVVAFDQPGYGRTPGDCHPSRSERILDKGGPADIAVAVAETLGFKTFIAGGYDWGAGIALALAKRDSKKVPKVIALLPSYTVSQDSDIKAITANVLVIWVKHDQMHNWTKWKAIANKLPKKTIYVIDSKPDQRSGGGNAYEDYSDEMLRQVAIFLGFGDPLAPAVELNRAPEIEGVNTQGDKVVKAQMITIRSQMDGATLAELAAEKENKEKLAFQPIFKQLNTLITTNSLNPALAKKDKAVLDLLRSLPDISPDSIRNDPSVFVNLGIWDKLPDNLSSMWSSPRYFKGRRLLAAIPTNPEIGAPNFLQFNPTSSQIHASNYCELVSFDENINTFTLKMFGGGKVSNIKRSLEDILLLNQDQVYGKDDAGKLILEDGIRANYSNPLVKAKIYQIAMALKPIVEQLDFEQPTQTTQALQRAAVMTIRKCLNIISFANGVDRDRVGRTDDVGILAVNGQGQCHGLSSTMSSYLLVFSSLLGIDLQYRGGTSYGDKSGSLSNAVEKHQWLQLTFRPAMDSFVCDLWYQDAQKDDRYLCLPLDEALKNLSCPHAKLLIKNSLAELQLSDIDESLLPEY